MKNLKYEKQLCDLCKGYAKLHICNTNKEPVQNQVSKLMPCPLCDGKGHLSILKTEEKKNESI